METYVAQRALVLRIHNNSQVTGQKTNTQGPREWHFSNFHVHTSYLGILLNVDSDTIGLDGARDSAFLSNTFPWDVGALV